MNKIELEKMFDDKFWYCFNKWVETDNITKDNIKLFIFETIIPEVLKSVIPKEYYLENINELSFFERQIKEKAKEQFWIDL